MLRESCLRVWSDAHGSELRTVLDTIRGQLPAGDVTTESRHAEGMAAVELLVVCLTHIAVVGIIEGVRLAWDIYRTPVKVELPNGELVTLRGGSPEFITQLTAFLEGMKHQTTHSADVARELEDLVDKIRAIKQ